MAYKTNSTFSSTTPPGAPPMPPAPNAASSSSGYPGNVNCPAGLKWNGYTCVPNGPAGPPPMPPAGPGNCPAGQVWRADTKQCEAPDARSVAGKETCTGPMPQCGNGQAAWCNFDTMQWECAQSQFSDAERLRLLNKRRAEMGKPPLSALPGGGGGGGAGGAGGAGSSLGAIPGLQEGQTLWQSILGRLQGGTRYTPEVMASLLGQEKLSADQQAIQQTEAANADLAQRGLGRSPAAAAAIQRIGIGANASVLQGRNAIIRAKIDADFQDKSAAIDEGQKWLDSLRSYVASITATKAQRDAAMANIALGYARLQQELDVMREQYQQKLQFCLLNPSAC